MMPSAGARKLHTRDRRPLSVVRPRPRPTLPPVEGFHDGFCDRGSEAAPASLRPCPPYHRTYDNPPQSDPTNGENRGKISIDNKTAGVHRGKGSTSRGATPQRVRRSTNPEPRLPSGPVELVVGKPGDGFGTGPGVNPESAQIPVVALGLQHHRRRATLSQMRKRRVTQLVQSPPAGVTAEQGGSLVQHPPQSLLPKRHATPAPQLVEVPVGDRSGGDGGLTAGGTSHHGSPSVSKLVAVVALRRGRRSR